MVLTQPKQLSRKNRICTKYRLTPVFCRLCNTGVKCKIELVTLKYKINNH